MLLKSTYSNALKLGLQNDCKSIAFPAISYGYPIREAAEISIEVCSDRRFKDISVYVNYTTRKRIWIHAEDQAT